MGRRKDWTWDFGKLRTRKQISESRELEGKEWMKIDFIWGNIYTSSREGNGTPLQYSCLENPMDGGAWWAAVHVVTKSPTWLSDFTFTFHFHSLEKEMATHSSVLAWRIPGMGEPGGLPSMESHRVRYDWSDLAAAAATHPDFTSPIFFSMLSKFLLKPLSFYFLGLFFSSSLFSKFSYSHVHHLFPSKMILILHNWWVMNSEF